MNKRLCVYTVILVILLVISLFVSKDDNGKTISWFNFGNKQILSLKYESQDLDVDIVKQDIIPSKQRLKDLKTLKNKGIYFLKYTSKKADPNKKESTLDSVMLQGSYELNRYLDNYTPFVVEKSFESNDLESFGIKESSPKISIQYENAVKTILVGNNKNDDERTYYYDPEKKFILIKDEGLVRNLRDALSALASYLFSDTKAKDVSYMKVVSSNKEKTIYKVTTIKDTTELPSWSLTSGGEPNDYVVKWIDYLMSFKVQDYLNITEEQTENIMNISMFDNKDNLIDSIKISKYKDGYVGWSNYTNSWVSIDKQEVEKVITQFNVM